MKFNINAMLHVNGTVGFSENLHLIFIFILWSLRVRHLFLRFKVYNHFYPIG